MRDWAEIDRTLEQLGPVPSDVAALIANVLGPDRSPQALETALQALGAEPAVIVPRHAMPRPASPLPAAPRRHEPSDRPLSSHDTMEEWPPESLPAAPRASDLDDATEDVLGASEPAPAYSFSSGTAPALRGGASSGTAPALRGGASISDAPLTSDAEGDEPELSLAATSDAPPAAATPTDSEPPLSTRALLDRELDPSEFPSRPPPRFPTPAPAPAAAAPAEEDDFELLIEDEEILEIQEDDVETDESDEP